MEGHRALTRRGLILGAPALIGLRAKAERRISGSFVNESFELGHRLRDGAAFPKPVRQARVPVVIVGGGMGGMCAAWRLDKRGFHDFVLLEMEPSVGGNARWGENDITRYPWAAHYVPVPSRAEDLARELFEEFGAFEDGRWKERYLCFAPQERLYIHARWQDGIEPELGATARERAQFQRFDAIMREQRATGGFTIPMEHGVRDSDLDRISMADWMRQQQFDSPYLGWYIDYCCRDDYGALARDTSAWAGIHYFASREPEEKGPLTWPEGNGWITRHLTAKLGSYIRTGSPVYRIERDGSRYRVLTPDTEYLAQHVIWAAPTFIAHYVVEGTPPADGFVYSPWLTANLTLDRMPDQRGAEQAWDNVIYGSPTLGYVDATHMSIATAPQERTVWTFYWSLAEYAPADGRRALLARDWRWWSNAILADLERAHPDIRDCVSRIDIMRLGHAMIRPAVGFITSENRKRWLTPHDRLYYANSDLSGLSLFEEAQYRGVTAAERVLRSIGGRI
jgi:phytoene dehydrogenase-like protein